MVVAVLDKFGVVPLVLIANMPEVVQGVFKMSRGYLDDIVPLSL